MPEPCAGEAAGRGLPEWFAGMIDHCIDYAAAAKAQNRPVVGITCEYTPREVILAAGGVPVCLCGGSAETIAPAESRLPANLCPLIKSTYGYALERSNPLLEMADLLVVETTCDGKKKMYELLAEDRPMHVLELPQKADDADARCHWLAEVRKLRDALGRRFGRQITDASLRGAIEAMNRERALRRRLADLMRADAPPLTGRELLALKSTISAMPGLQEALAEACSSLSSPAAARADLARRVRVLLTGVPVVHGAERVVDLIEGHGGLVVAMENCTGLKPILDDVDAAAPDPLAAIAQKYLHLPCSVLTPNNARLELLSRLAREYRPACVVELIWQACLTYDVESYRVKRHVEDVLGLPYLRIVTDYSPADSARIAVRVEAMFETVAARRA